MSGRPHETRWGLATAYWLRDRNILLFEREAQTGGVAKSESWNGLEYALGAAYIVDPDPESEDDRERRGFELLKELDLRVAGEDLSRDRSRQRRRESLRVARPQDRRARRLHSPV